MGNTKIIAFDVMSEKCNISHDEIEKKVKGFGIPACSTVYHCDGYTQFIGVIETSSLEYSHVIDFFCDNFDDATVIVLDYDWSDIAIYENVWDNEEKKTKERIEKRFNLR